MNATSATQNPPPPLDLSVVIPVFNEERDIEHTIQKVGAYIVAKGLRGEIIIVDDGSTDATSIILQRLTTSIPYLHPIFLKKNHGKGYAVKTGILSAHGNIILFMDADGSTDTQEFDTFLPFFKTGADVVIGSRYLPHSNIIIQQPRYRVLLGRISNRVIQSILLSGIVDTQCGFKAFTHKAAQDIFSRQTIARWAFDMEILAIARHKGYTIQETPIQWSNSTKRASRLRPIKDTLRTLRDLIKIKTRFLLKRYDTHETPPTETAPLRSDRE